jgi:hypothetical protein
MNSITQSGVLFCSFESSKIKGKKWPFRVVRSIERFRVFNPVSLLGRLACPAAISSFNSCRSFVAFQKINS